MILEISKAMARWYLMFDTFVFKYNYVRSHYDSCGYYKLWSKSSHTYLFLYVNDILLPCKNMIEINKLIEQLKKKFKIKYLITKKKMIGTEPSLYHT